MRTNYLEGRARLPYTRSPSLNASEESDAQGSASSGICVRCNPILSRYAVTFKGMVSQGTELKRRKHLNPNPKRTDATPYEM